MNATILVIACILTAIAAAIFIEIAWDWHKARRAVRKARR